MTVVAADTTDDRALASSSLLRTRGGSTDDQSGTLVHFGSGVYLTAGHVLYQYVNPGTVRTAEDYRLSVRDGLDGAYEVAVGESAFQDTFRNLGWGSEGGADISAAFTADTQNRAMPVLIFADPDDAAGRLTTFGYPNVDGYDGSTMIEVEGTLAPGGHRAVTTGNGDMTVLVSEPGMQVRSGQSGSGMFLSADPDGDGQFKEYLAGIVTLDIQLAGGLHSTGFEPLGDVYAALGALIEANGLFARDFARATLVSGQSPGSDATQMTGTVLYEDLFGGINADTLDGGAGKDRLWGGGADDILIDGAGVDAMTGGAGGDTFRMSADGDTDVIRDFQDGSDVIDVTAWNVTSFDQLTVQTWGPGQIMVRAGGEKLVLENDSQPIGVADIDASDFVFAAPGVNTIDGTAGRDKLIGTEGDDKITDFGGIDAMFGRAGADRFVLVADAEDDHIKDFEDGIDLIDLSAWTGATLAGLEMQDMNNGKVLIVWDDERLVVMDSTRTLTQADLDQDDFIFA